MFDPYFFPLHVGFIFFFGALFGSFFNVCIYRIPRGVPLSMPPSHCYQCGQPIRWYDNIPLVSYWVLRGRCRHCGAHFSARYFFVELLTACLWTIAFVRYCNPERGYTFVFIPAILFVSMLIIETFTDIDHWIIPDRISLGGLAVGIVLSFIPAIAASPHNPLSRPLGILPIDIPPQFVPTINSLAGAALGYCSLWFMAVIGTMIFRKEAMGRGDWKLFAMIGSFTGPLNCLFVLVVACFIGSLAGAAGLLVGYAKRRQTPGPAVAGLVPDPFRCERVANLHDLMPTEWLVVTRALTQPGPVGPVRHHLPFGPSLAAAAIIIYLTWEPIHDWFFASPFWIQ